MNTVEKISLWARDKTKGLTTPESQEFVKETGKQKHILDSKQQDGRSVYPREDGACYR